MNRRPSQATAAESSLLSPFEHQILRHLALGQTRLQIAKILGSSEGTIKQYVSELQRKLDARNSTNVVARAIALGLLSPDTALHEHEWPIEEDMPTPEPLTEREHQILRLISYGSVTNAGLARALHIEESTVKRHLSNIFGKLGAEDRRHAVAIARQHGIL
jgi:DNA-binding NarL/FixJ family response regulator